MKHKDIIELWPSPQKLAEETGQKYNTVMKWRYRNAIPSKQWPSIVEAAQRSDLPVTYKILAESL